MALKWFGSDIHVMKTIRLLSLTGIALVGFAQLTSASPQRGGFGGRPFGGGGRFGGSHFGGYAGVPHAVPAFSGGARSNGASTGTLTRTPQQFYYYSGTRTSGATQHAFVRQPPSRSVTANAGSRSTMARQQNRAGSLPTKNTRVGNSQMTAAAVRRAIANHNVFARHDGNWHRDWDKHRSHFHQRHVFVFIDGFWWGLSPAYFAGNYPSYGYGDYPYDYSDNPSDYYDYFPYDYDEQPASVDSNQYGNNSIVSAVQSGLAKLGYYRGAIDGVEGDETQAALARYQQDHHLSVTGTLTAATLQSLGLKPTAG
jgi:Putative peptidoglycan binding domain